MYQSVHGLQELEQKQAEEEARREDERLAAEQARLAAQFEQEQNKERAKANKTADVEEQVAGAWNAAKATAAKERRKTIEERRRSQGLLGCHILQLCLLRCLWCAAAGSPAMLFMLASTTGVNEGSTGTDRRHGMAWCHCHPGTALECNPDHVVTHHMQGK